MITDPPAAGAAGIDVSNITRGSSAELAAVDGGGVVGGGVVPPPPTAMVDWPVTPPAVAWIVALPELSALTTPSGETAATVGAVLDHATDLLASV